MARETILGPGRSWYAVLAASSVAAVLWGLAPGAMAQNSPLAQKAPEAAEMLAQAQRQGHVRVIVQFDGPPVRPDPDSIAAAKAQIAATQTALMRTHLDPAAGFDRAITRFELTPAFAANVTAAELEKLAADPRVKSINLDHVVPPARARGKQAPTAPGGP